MTRTCINLKAVQRRAHGPRRVHPADEPECPNENAGISAVSSAAGGNLIALRLTRRPKAPGDFTALCERLRDPAVALTMLEREWLARQLEGGDSGTPVRGNAALLVWWFENAEGLDRAAAIRRACAVLGKSDRNPKGISADAVTKAVQRANNPSPFDPGEHWQRNAQWYRDGARASQILPPGLRPDGDDFTEFLANRTE